MPIEVLGLNITWMGLLITIAILSGLVALLPRFLGTTGGSLTRVVAIIFIGAVVIIIIMIVAKAVNSENGSDDESTPTPTVVVQEAIVPQPTMTPTTVSNPGPNPNSIPRTAQEAAQKFGGNAENWTPLGGTGWVYRGAFTRLQVPMGFRLDTPSATCEGVNSTGHYGPAQSTTDRATAWWVGNEVNCGRS